MSGTPQPDAQQLPFGVERKDSRVNIAELSAPLLGTLAILGKVHQWLFEKQLVVTSGNDGAHVKGSKHYRNKAVDVRSEDKSEAEQLLFAHLLAFLARKRSITVFDKRARPDGPHWHLEDAV